MNHEITSQPRSSDGLIASPQLGRVPKWVSFWGHTPARDGSVSKSCSSQWWEGNPFEADGVFYRTAEHWMMAEKARLFGDMDTLMQIVDASSPALAKKLGRAVKGFDDGTWRDARWEIVVRGNIMETRERLIATDRE